MENTEVQRKCLKCLIKKPLSNYSQYGTRYGKPSYKSACKDCSEESTSSQEENAEKRTCNQCGIEKLIDEFVNNGSQNRGRMCTKCYNYNRSQKRKAKTTKVCTECKVEKSNDKFMTLAIKNNDKCLTTICQDCVTFKYKVDLDALKQCITCTIEKPYKNFFLFYIRNEKAMFSTQCDECARERDRKQSTITDKSKLVCLHCNEIKPIDEFVSDSSKDLNKRNICKKCSCAAVKENFHKYKEYVAEKKQEIGECAHCRRFHPYIMEFDHNQGIKNKNISRINNVNAFEKELIFVQLLCGVCHAIKSYNEMQEKKKLWEYSNTPECIKRLKIIQRNRDYVNKIKTDSGCEICHYNNLSFPCTLDFDHIDRTKKTNTISQMVMGGNSLDLIKEELLNTRILCKNCHKIKTMENEDYFSPFKQQSLSDLYIAATGNEGQTNETEEDDY